MAQQVGYPSETLDQHAMPERLHFGSVATSREGMTVLRTARSMSYSACQASVAALEAVKRTPMRYQNSRTLGSHIPPAGASASERDRKRRRLTLASPYQPQILPPAPGESHDRDNADQRLDGEEYCDDDDGSVHPRSNVRGLYPLVSDYRTAKAGGCTLSACWTCFETKANLLTSGCCDSTSLMRASASICTILMRRDGALQDIKTARNSTANISRRHPTAATWSRLGSRRAAPSYC